MHVICKLFNFFLAIFDAVLTVVVSAITSLVGAAFTVLDAVLSGTAGLLGNPITWIALGLGAWWLLSGDDDEASNPIRQPTSLSEVTNG